MRPLLLFAVSFFLLVAVSFPAQAQEWRLQKSGVEAELVDICFVDSLNGWACGRDGMIVSTTNGGETWDKQQSGTLSKLSNINFVDPLHGWIPVIAPHLLRTTNGGSSWQIIAHPDTIGIAGVCFISADVGWGIGPISAFGTGIIHKTTDGGRTWQPSLDLTGRDPWNTSFTCIEFFDENVGFAAGATGFMDNFEEGRVWRTIDGGESWEWIYSRTGIIRSISLLEPGIVLIGSQSALASSMSLSTDNGDSWTDLNHQTGPTFTSSSSRSTEISDRHTLWAFVGDIIVSRDLGETWTTSTREESGPVNDICFVDSVHGWAVGDQGRIWRYHPETVAVEHLPAVSEFRIEALYPNPGRASVTIEYVLGVRQNVRIVVYSLLGTEIAVLENGLRERGSHRVEFSAPAHLPSGLYFYEMQTPQGTARGSMLLAK